MHTLFYCNNAAAAAAAKSLQSCPTLCDLIDSSPPGSHPWDSPGKNTGVGCHFLLQCMKVKRESEVDQSCRTLSDPMDCNLPGSSVHGIFQARVLEWGANLSMSPLHIHSIFWPCSAPSPLLPFRKIITYLTFYSNNLSHFFFSSPLLYKK